MNDSPQWYTLTYRTESGRFVTLYNLLRGGVDRITQKQQDLGSTSFDPQAQPHAYSQQEIDLLRGKEPR
jgi:hypothetical protein